MNTDVFLSVFTLLIVVLFAKYTFTSHLKWTPVIAFGYFGSIEIHFLINSRFF
jgi:hypothetical protein